MLRYIWCQQTNIYTCFIFIHRFFSAGGLAAPLGVAAAATIGGAVGEAFLRVVHRLRWEKGAPGGIYDLFEFLPSTTKSRKKR